ncbi:MAG: hypothetical protein ACKOET_19260 [Verrucomicrobiota bacterium]
MRYFFRPSGTIAWREWIFTLVALGGVLWFFPQLWRSLAAIVGPWIASAFCALPLLAWRQPSVRNSFMAGIGGLTSLRSAVRQESGQVEGSEAEREWRSRDGEAGGSYLTAHANYVVRVRRTDGARRTLQLPREIWAPLRVGEEVRWTRRGIWLLEIHGTAGRLEPAPPGPEGGPEPRPDGS